jgi:hypothetical protein
MLGQLHVLLFVKQDSYPTAISHIVQNRPRQLGSLSAQERRKPTIEYVYGEDGVELGVDGKNKIKRIVGKTKMPWLVPACSQDDLQKKIQEAGVMLFPGATIAGLVPGVILSPFDAYAYLWTSNCPLEWAFEFKARSDGYALQKGCEDLNRKCTRLVGEYHAMLLCIEGRTTGTKARVWLEGGKKLRVVLIVGNKS